jgi:sulfatase maturation enzyme AslB (radical SAM superfamily)
MSEHTQNTRPQPFFSTGKFSDPDWTAKGEPRARIGLQRLETLWINTGSLCNIECVNCYIESSPANDRLAYFTLEDAAALFDEIEQLRLGTSEIGFTGGEPFMNPEMLAMVETALKRGFKVLILTNAMQPMMRKQIKQGLLDLNSSYPGQLELRVSLDHYSERLHDMERGPGAFAKAIDGLDWLSANSFNIAVAGRTCWNEDEAEARRGYQALFSSHNWKIDPANHGQLILFPEMDETADISEITTACWSILGVKPSDMMCASSRMAVKRKGENTPAILPCTLLPFDAEFEMGSTLARSMSADGGAFSQGAVKLNHPHCAKFCVLGGGSCSVEK